MITTTEKNPWQKRSASEKKGIELRVIGEAQEIRGFGACFSELSAEALSTLHDSERSLLLDELFDGDKCNFNY